MPKNQPAKSSTSCSTNVELHTKDMAFAAEDNEDNNVNDSNAEDSKNIAGLIHDARDGRQKSLGQLLQLYQNYLNILASSQIDKRLLPRVSPSDVVQETMLRAHKNFAQFRGGSEGELVAWLRQILVNNLASFVEKHLRAARRDIRREVSIERFRPSVEESAIRLAALLPASNKSPSVAVQHREEVVVLTDRLAQLSADYREVLVLRNLQSLTFEEISQRMNRSESASRMLWLRAIEKIRTIYMSDESNED